MKLITRDTDYALRAICFMARNKKELFSVPCLAKELKIPGPFLRKLLQVLHNKGVLNSFKGKGGGFSLKKNPEEILLIDIMRVFQGKFCLNECFLGKGICPHTRNCPLRGKISRIENYVKRELASVTVSSLIGEIKSYGKKKNNRD